MSVPTHGPFCQTLIYDTVCWSCQEEIYVFQCSCGSVVLFDECNPPWPKHVCGGTGDAGGVGGSGISGWQAIDVLRANGAPITPDIIRKIFASEESEPRKTKKAEEIFAIVKIDPKPKARENLIAIVRELPSSTKKTKSIESLTTIGIKMLGLDTRKHYRQITLVHNGTRPNKSYTALVPEDLIRNLDIDRIVMVEMMACIKGKHAHWVVTDINLL